MNIVIDRLPENLSDFEAMKEMDLSRPENACTMFLLALNLFAQDRDVGIEAINILKGPVDMSTYEKNFVTDRLRDKSYLPLIYFEGARPENNYEPNKPYKLNFLADPRPGDLENGYIRLYLKTAGADAPRAIKLRQKDGNWYIWEYPGIVMDVRKPAKEDPWA